MTMSSNQYISDSNPDRPAPSDKPAGLSHTCAEKRWYVVRSKPRQESVCLEEMAKAGVEGLCPLRMEYRFRRRRKEAVPLFPGYVFCKIGFPEGYHKVRWLRGVLHLVQFGEAAPPALDDDIMKFFIQNMNEEGIVETEPDLVAGDKVEFLTEPLRGLVGTVLRLDSADQRVHVLMDLLYQATIEVDTYQVQAI